MILIGENLNIMSKTYGPAIKEQNDEVLTNIINIEKNSGVDYIDLNIGPSKSNGINILPYLTDLCQKNCNLKLSLDTSNYLAIEEALKICNQTALINSVSLQEDRINNTLPLVSAYNADMIGLLWGEDGMPRDVDERCMNMVNLLMKTQEQGVKDENVWIDPIVTPVSGDINQVISCLEFMDMLPAINPNCKSIVGLSNVSNGAPKELRPYLNRTFLVMLMRKGLYSAIVDAQDSILIDIAKGKCPEITNTIHDAMDGAEINCSDSELVKYAKTVKILTGETVYSDLWLN